jgi:hypothetical protein
MWRSLKHTRSGAATGFADWGWHRLAKPVSLPHRQASANTRSALRKSRVTERDKTGTVMNKTRLGVRLFVGGLIGIGLQCNSTTASAQNADAFFKTATLSMYVGSGAGGGYDIVGRLVAHHMSRFLPGKPTFVIKNMDGASGVTESNYIYNVAPKDGSAISAATNSSLILPLYGASVAKYDPRKFEWIGSTDKQTAICVTWNTVPVKSLEDATKREVTVSATGVSAGPGVYP